MDMYLPALRTICCTFLAASEHVDSQANEEKAPRLEKSRSDLTGRDANNILTCTKT